MEVFEGRFVNIVDDDSSYAVEDVLSADIKVIDAIPVGESKDRGKYLPTWKISIGEVPHLLPPTSAKCRRVEITVALLLIRL